MTSSFRALKYKSIKLCATINLYPSADLWIQLLSFCNGYVQCHDVQAIAGRSSVSCSSLTSAVTVSDRAPRKALIMRLQLPDDNPEETKEVSHIAIDIPHLSKRGCLHLQRIRLSGSWWCNQDVCWIPLSTRPCGYRGAGEPADRCWQMDYLQGQRWSWLLPEPNWQARVNQSQPLPIQTPGVSPPKPWRCHLLPAGVKQLTVNSHIHIRDQAGCYKSRRGI